MSALPPFRQEGWCPIPTWQARVPSDSPESDPTPAYTLGGKDQSLGGWRVEAGGSYRPHTDCVGTITSHWPKQSAQAEMLAGQGQRPGFSWDKLKTVLKKQQWTMQLLTTR